MEREFIAAKRSEVEHQINSTSQDAKDYLTKCAAALLEDISRVAEDITDVLSYQTQAMETLATEVGSLSGELAQRQRACYDEAILSMTSPSTRPLSSSMTPLAVPAKAPSGSPQNKAASSPDSKAKKSANNINNASSSNLNASSNPSSSTSTSEAVRILPLEDVLPAELLQRLQTYQEQQQQRQQSPLQHYHSSMNVKFAD